jgi:hypothetical protein
LIKNPNAPVVKREGEEDWGRQARDNVARVGLNYQFH